MRVSKLGQVLYPMISVWVREDEGRRHTEKLQGLLTATRGYDRGMEKILLQSLLQKEQTLLTS